MKDYFLKVKLARCDFDLTKVSPQGMVRLIASDKVFYLNQEDFANAANFLKCLKPGDELKVCAELLNDGSFWVSWLYHDTKGMLEPNRTFPLQSEQIKWLFIAFFLTVFGGGWSYFSLLYLEQNFFVIVSMIISTGVVLVSISSIGEKLFRIFQFIRPKQRKRIRALDNVIAKQDTIAADNQQLIIENIKQSRLPRYIKATKSLPQFKQSDVQSIRGKIKLHHVDRIKIYRRYHEGMYLQISCQINKKPIVFSYRERPFYSDSNLFIADGDDIELFFLPSDNNSAAPIFLGVYNYTDNGAYLISGQMYLGNRQANRTAILTAGLIFAFIFTLTAIFEILDVFEKGGYWDKWDWLSIGNTFLGMTLIVSAIISGFALIIVLCSNLYILLSEKGKSRYQTYYLLQQRRIDNKQSSYITELSV